MRRRYFLPLSVAALVCLGVPSALASGTSADPDGSDAAWSAKCFFVANAQIDPIEHYGEPTSPHMHSFVGEPGPTNILQPSVLRGDPVDDCNSPSLPAPDGSQPDKSQYWAPSLYSTNKPAVWARPSSVLIYYRDANVAPDSIVPFDRNYSIRAGKSDATVDQPADRIRWSCVAAKHQGGSPNEIKFGATIPGTCSKYLDGDTTNPFFLRLVVYFPNCVNFDDVDTSNGQWKPRNPGYAIDNGGLDKKYTHVCTDPLYTPIPQVQVGFRWALKAGLGITDAPGDPTSWDLSSLGISSDAAGQPGGITAHIDFMSGWTTTQLATLMKACFWTGAHLPPGVGPTNCGTIGGATPAGDN